MKTKKLCIMIFSLLALNFSAFAAAGTACCGDEACVLLAEQSKEEPKEKKKNFTHFKGAPVELAGSFVAPGQNAPKFSLVKGDLSQYALKDGKGKRLLLNIFPSMDTKVCSLSVKKFNELAAGMPNTQVLCISKDLPFAQARFCATEGIKNLIALSDFRPASNFGKQYGVLIKSGPMRGLLARAVVLIDEKGKVIYSQLVDEITKEPDYEAVLKALKNEDAEKKAE